ncbi:adenosine deaminase [Raphidocelis subcapitata]|uniref:Adenosine deaminase n=1 Tax=Raphidocelis subcapitata TaxID=307507 RepID=A0A2V0P0P4_9CHLO|nr:adenosine deaminase [Raphidocelis subcapitata]|eukprot:GBF93438.1 adenosine deaminase [Raphidocelis subcapitata]
MPHAASPPPCMAAPPIERDAADVSALVSCPAPPHPAFAADGGAALRRLIRQLPKAELHLHIEGTLEVDLMFKLAARNGVALPYADAAAARAARASYAGLQDFLDVYNACTAVLLTEDDFFELADAYLARAAADNVLTAEMFVDVQGHMARGVPLDAIASGLLRAAAASPVDASFILCIQRELGPAAASEALKAARPYVPSAFIGLGLAGAEVGNMPSEYEAVFAEAEEMGLHKMAHAGEEGGARYVWEAIRALRVERVDHGIRALEDPQLVAAMAAARLPITLCPLSNLRLQVYAGELEARVREVLASGIAHCYVDGNYEWVARVAGLGPEQLAQLAAASFEASFLPKERKKAHVAAVWGAFDAWRAEEGQPHRPAARGHPH